MLRVDLDRLQLDDNSIAGGPIRVGFPLSSAARTAAAVPFELEPEAALATHTDSAEEVPLEPDGAQVMVIGAPIPVASPLAGAAR